HDRAHGEPDRQESTGRPHQADRAPAVAKHAEIAAHARRGRRRRGRELLVPGTLRGSAATAAAAATTAATATAATAAAASAASASSASAAAAADAALAPGATLGRYVLVEAVGSGGMGMVFRARDPDLGREVAVKVLRAGDGTGGSLERRLLREAQAMATISHDN